MFRSLSLTIALLLGLTIPGLAHATDYHRRYHWGQGMAWAGLIALPAGPLWAVGTEVAIGNDYLWLPGLTAVAGAPLAMSIGGIRASGALSHIPGARGGSSRKAGWWSLGLIGASASLAGLAPGVSIFGDGAVYVIGGVYALSVIPSTVQLFRNRRCYQGAAEELDRELRELEEDGWEISVAPFVTREGRGLVLAARF